MSDSPKTASEWRTAAVKLEDELNNLRQDYNEFKALSEDIEKDLNAEIDELSKQLDQAKNQVHSLNGELSRIRERSNKYESEYRESEEERGKLKDCVHRFEIEMNDFKTEIVQLQIDNDEVRNQLRQDRSQLRNQRGRNTHLEQTLDTMLEENGLLKTQLEDTKNQAKEQIYRLRQQLDQSNMEVSMKEREIKKLRKGAHTNSYEGLSPSQGRNDVNTNQPIDMSGLRSPHRRATVYAYGRYTSRSSLAAPTNQEQLSMSGPQHVSAHHQSFHGIEETQNSSMMSKSNGRRSFTEQGEVMGINTPVHMPIIEGDAHEESSPEKISQDLQNVNLPSNPFEERISLRRFRGESADDEDSSSTHLFQRFHENRLPTFKGKKLSEMFDMEQEKINMDKLLELDLEKESFITPCTYALSMVNDLIQEMGSHTVQLNERKGDIAAHLRQQDELHLLGNERLAVMG